MPLCRLWRWCLPLLSPAETLEEAGRPTATPAVAGAEEEEAAPAAAGAVVVPEAVGARAGRGAQGVAGPAAVGTRPGRLTGPPIARQRTGGDRMGAVSR